MRFALYMPKIFLRYAWEWNIPEICMELFWDYLDFIQLINIEQSRIFSNWSTICGKEL